MTLFADIIIPVPIKDTYTFSVPAEIAPFVSIGHRVEVSFGPRKKYSGIVTNLHHDAPREYTVKPILSLLDSEPIIRIEQLNYWRLLAKYYVCTLGEIMQVALPAGIKLNSESIYVSSTNLSDELPFLEGDEAFLAEALLYQGEMTHKDVERLFEKKNVHPIIRSLVKKGLIHFKEELVHTYKVKTEKIVLPTFELENSVLEEIFDSIKNAPKQAEVILYLIQSIRQNKKVTTRNIEESIKGSSEPIKALSRKGLVTVIEQPISRHDSDDVGVLSTAELSPLQVAAKQQIKSSFEQKNVTLLHGITGSGKTLIYVQFIEEVIARGGQVLFMVPEIALTTQLVRRLAVYFGNQAGVYHSSMGSNHKIDLWLDVSKGKSLIIGARSSLFLPFTNLQLIIIDEEHDHSYKQNDPAPRYHARDAAILLAQQIGAKVLLGSATPSIETYYNAQQGKYGLVTLSERFGDAVLPEVHLIDRKKLDHKKNKGSHFSPVLVREIMQQLQENRQVIIFQNRRGFSATLVCNMCGWVKKCKNCDVSMTYHKYNNSFQCHYCGWHQSTEKACPACGNVDLSHRGIGTERVEEELALLFPEANIARMDMDTVKGKMALNELLYKLETGAVNILIGTQMVSKGLDFEGIGLVGIVSADQLAAFPDFRAHERAFQLMLQVSGRSGRSATRGKVYIQYENMRMDILQLVTRADYPSFYRMVLEERKKFLYPPFCKLIKIQIKQVDPAITRQGAEYLSKLLKDQWGNRIIGPAPALIPRVNNRYIYEIMIKMERQLSVIDQIKTHLLSCIQDVKTHDQFKRVSISLDIDPN